MSTCPHCKATVLGRQSKHPCPKCRTQLGLSEPSGRVRRSAGIRSPYAPRTHPSVTDEALMAGNKMRPTPDEVRARLIAQGVNVDRPDPDEDNICPDCGKVLLNPAGLGGHRWRAHGVRGYRVTGLPDRPSLRAE